MKFRYAIAGALVATVFAGAAYSADEPQVVRQELMKENGKALGKMVAMVKGEAPFDQAVVVESLNEIHDDMLEFIKYFPEGSETGFETEAKPAIWENKDDFEAKAQKTAADAMAMAEAPPADLDALKASFGPFAGNCGGCHKVYKSSN